MRGVVRYRPHPVVAILDSERAGADATRTSRSSPRSPTRLPYEPTDRARRRRRRRRAARRRSGARSSARRSSAGLDVEAGMHEFLSDDAELAALAAERGVELARPAPAAGRPERPDRREPRRTARPSSSPSAPTARSGRRRWRSSCDREAERRGLRSVFVPTGQTGIMIAGWGIAVDAVVADFLAGAAERLVVEGARRGDLLWVGGPGRARPPAVLRRDARALHGSAPHAARALPHGRRRRRSRASPGHPIPPLAELVELYERVGLPVRPAKVAAVALNTSAPRRGGGATRSRRGRGARPGSSPTTRSASAPAGSWTPSSRTYILAKGR